MTRPLARLALASALLVGVAAPALAMGSEPPPAATDARGATPPDARKPDGTTDRGSDGKTELAPDKADDKSDRPRKRRSSDWRDTYRQAVALINDARFEEAIALLEPLTVERSPDVLNELGYAQRRLGRLAEARGFYEQALALDADHRGALEYYGELLVQIGEIERARGHLTQLAGLCAAACNEYLDLKQVIEAAGR